jgi:hypothetical protein
MTRTMKWFIACLIITFFGLDILVGMYSGLTFHFVSSSIDEYHFNNLLIIYDIKE